MLGIELKGPDMLGAYESTFRKSAIEDFRRFVVKNRSPKRWIIASDYVFKGKNASKHTATFTIFPDNREFSELISEIQEAETKDIKKTHGVSDKLMRYFKRNRFFPIVNVFDKWLPLSPGKDDVTALVEICESWKTVCLWAPELTAKFGSKIDLADTAGLIMDLIASLPKYNKDKVELVRQFVVVVNIAAYLTKMLRDEFSASDVVWFSDRDPMLAHNCGNDYQRFAPAIYSLCSQTYKANSTDLRSDFRPVYAVPNGTKDLWYKPLIRVADYFCGTFSRIAQDGEPIDRSLHKLLYEYALSHPIVALKVTKDRIGRFSFTVRARH